MIRRILMAVLAVLLLTACTGNSLPESTATEMPTPQPSDTPTNTPEPPTSTPLPTLTPTTAATVTSTPVAYGPGNYPANVDPLTGMSAADSKLLARRPVSVKIQIFPRGQRPPWGASLADIVYDYYQNSGMTRFHAIFLGTNAEQVGPIRSGRLFDKQLVSMYKSILAFGGADRRILSTFLNSDFANRLVLEGYNNCPPMCRIEPNGSNFLVANTEEITKYAEKKKISNEPQDMGGMTFHSIAPAGSRSGVQLSVRWSISAYARWDYDAASGRYLRFQDTQEDQQGTNEAYAPLIDRLTGKQIAADNVVVLLIPHQYAFSTKPGNGEIIDIVMGTTGYAFAFRDGQFYEVRWNRSTKDSVLALTFPDGKPYPFKPGNTWFEVVGQSSQVLDKGNGVWRFVFKIP